MWSFLRWNSHFLFSEVILQKLKKNIAVHLKVDNTATVAFINKKKAANKVVFTIIKNIWEFCM